MVIWFANADVTVVVSFLCRRDPLYAILCQLAIIATLKSYPTLGDISLGVSLLPLFPSIIPRASSLSHLSLSCPEVPISCPTLFHSHARRFALASPSDLRHPLTALTLHLYTLILLPLLHHLWLGAGSGNANFFYASTLVFGLGNAMFGIDLVVAGRLKGFDLKGARESVEMKEGRGAGDEGVEGVGEGKWEVVQVNG